MPSLDHLVVFLEEFDVFIFPNIALAQSLFECDDLAICFFGILDDIFGHFRKFFGEVVSDRFTISDENMEFKFGILNMFVVARAAIAGLCGYLFFIEARRFYSSRQDLPPVQFCFLTFQRG